MGQLTSNQTVSSPFTINGRHVFYSAVASVTLAMFFFVLLSKSLSEWLSQNGGPRAANYLDELLFVGFILFVATAVVVSRRLYISPLILLLIILFSLIGWITTLLNDVRTDVAFLGFLLIIKPLILLLVYQAIPFNKRSATAFLKWFDYFVSAIALISVAYVIILEIGAGTNPLPGTVPGEIRLGLAPSRSFFTHPSSFSSILTLIAFYAFAQVLLRNSKRHLFIFFVVCLGVLLSLRMKAFFLLPVGISIIFVLVKVQGFRISKKTLLWGTALTAIGIGAIILFSFLFQDVLYRRLGNSSDSVRTVLMRNAVTINKETYGFGAGFGMYGGSISADYQYSPLYYRFNIHRLRGASPQNTSFITDQWWAWYLGEVGIWVTLLFTGTLFYVVYRLIKLASYWRNDNKQMAVFAYAAVGSLLFGILAGFAGVYLTAPPTGYFIMAMAGLSFSLHRGLYQDARTTATRQEA